MNEEIEKLKDNISFLTNELSSLKGLSFDSKELQSKVMAQHVMIKTILTSFHDLTTRIEVIDRLCVRKGLWGSELLEAEYNELKGLRKKDVSELIERGDIVWVDVSGVDESGAVVDDVLAKNYPIRIGSGAHIFEEYLIKKKVNSEHKFPKDIPGDYPVVSLRNKKITYHIVVRRVKTPMKKAPGVMVH